MKLDKFEQALQAHVGGSAYQLAPGSLNTDLDEAKNAAHKTESLEAWKLYLSKTVQVAREEVLQQAHKTTLSADEIAELAHTTIRW